MTSYPIVLGKDNYIDIIYL